MPNSTRNALDQRLSIPSQRPAEDEVAAAPWSQSCWYDKVSDILAAIGHGPEVNNAVMAAVARVLDEGAEYGVSILINQATIEVYVDEVCALLLEAQFPDLSFARI